MSSAWLPLFTALIAACSALSAVFLTNYLGRKDRQAEREFKASQDARDFLIARGEDLYVHLDQMDAYVAEHCRTILAFCGSRIDFDAFRAAREGTLADRDKFSVSRIKLSLRSFFPALVPAFDDLTENLARIDMLDRALLETDRHDASLLYRANSDAVRLQDLVTTRGEELREALAKLLADLFAARAAGTQS
jgi:hypothetical protein